MTFEEYEIEVFDWPTRFFVSAEQIDKLQKEHYPDDLTLYPYLVDTEEGCTCEDYVFEIAPFLPDGKYQPQAYQRTQCIHLLLVEKYLNRNPQKPKPLPTHI